MLLPPGEEEEYSVAACSPQVRRSHAGRYWCPLPATSFSAREQRKVSVPKWCYRQPPPAGGEDRAHGGLIACAVQYGKEKYRGHAQSHAILILSLILCFAKKLAKTHPYHHKNLPTMPQHITVFDSSHPATCHYDRSSAFNHTVPTSTRVPSRALLSRRVDTPECGD